MCSPFATAKAAATAGFLVLSLSCAVAHAQMYKWVDANGRIHYSDRKDDAGSAKVKEMKVDAVPAPAPDSPEPEWKKREAAFQRRLKQRQALEASASYQPPVLPRNPHYVRKPSSVPKYRLNARDELRCNLAYDILNGEVVHTNGAPTDKYDRDVAKNDIARFCR